MNDFLTSLSTPATPAALYRRSRDRVSVQVLPPAEARRELDRLLGEITLPNALRFVRHIERLPQAQRVHVREMSAVDLTVLFAHHLSVRRGKLITRHVLLFEELSVPQYKQVIDLVEYGSAKYPQRFWHPGQKY